MTKEEARRRLGQAEVADRYLWEVYYRRTQSAPMQGVAEAWRTWMKAAAQLWKMKSGVWLLEERERDDY
jgi:hypothetical protein